MRYGTRSRASLRRREDILGETGVVATETGPRFGCIFLSATSTPNRGRRTASAQRAAGSMNRTLQQGGHVAQLRSEEHTSELQSLMRISYAVFCLKKNNKKTKTATHTRIRPTISTNVYST